MRATPRRLTLLAGLVLGLLTVPGAALVAGGGAWAAGEEPTVTFARGFPPRACSSAPSVTSVSVPEGTGIVVANATGRDGSVHVGGASVLPVADGTGVLLVLAVGQHEVRLVLECHTYNQAGPLAVTVTGEAPPPPPPPAESAPDSAPASTTSAAPPSTSPNLPAAPTAAGAGGAQTSTRPGSAGSGGGRAPATTAGEPSTGSAATPAGTTSAAAPMPGATVPGPMAAGVISATPVALVDPGHSKGLRLLAAVATICVLGVTAAIIRAIVRLSP